MTNPDDIKIGISYTGPHIHFPMTVLQLQNLISAFKNKQVNDKGRLTRAMFTGRDYGL